MLRRGLAGTRVSDICAKARISPGHLYHYFDSKDSIIAAFVETTLEETDGQLTERIGGCGPIEAVLTDLGWLKRPEEFALRFEILAQAGRSLKIAKILQSHSEGLRLKLFEAVRQGQISGEIDEGVDPLLASTALIGVMDALKAGALRYPEMDPSTAAASFKPMIERYIAPRPD